MDLLCFGFVQHKSALQFWIVAHNDDNLSSGYWSAANGQWYNVLFSFSSSDGLVEAYVDGTEWMSQYTTSGSMAVSYCIGLCVVWRRLLSRD